MSAFALLCTVALNSTVADAASRKNEPAYLDRAAPEVTSEPDTDSCGLGWQVTKKKTMFGTTTRATTNGFVPPTFGMTSGTIGCAQHPFAKNEQAAATYAMVNYDRLSIEMAEGHGAYLNGLARSMGCSDVQAFGKMTQSHYQELLPQGQDSAVKMFQNLKQQIKSDGALSSNCQTS